MHKIIYTTLQVTCVFLASLQYSLIGSEQNYKKQDLKKKLNEMLHIINCISPHDRNVQKEVKKSKKQTQLYKINNV